MNVSEGRGGNGRHLSPGSVSGWVWEGLKTHARGQMCTHRQRGEASVHSAPVSSFSVFFCTAVGTLAIAAHQVLKQSLQPRKLRNIHTQGFFSSFSPFTPPPPCLWERPGVTVNCLANNGHAAVIAARTMEACF